VNECREAGGSAAGRGDAGISTAQRWKGNKQSIVKEKGRRGEEERRAARRAGAYEASWSHARQVDGHEGFSGACRARQGCGELPYPYQRVVKRIADLQSRRENSKNTKQLHRCALFFCAMRGTHILVAYPTARVHPCRTGGTVSCGR
jgi:hypothetical protein